MVQTISGFKVIQIIGASDMIRQFIPYFGTPIPKCIQTKGFDTNNSWILLTNGK